MSAAVKIKYPGLIKEPMPSGNYRYRVRVQGRPSQRIPLHHGPDHPKFTEHYLAARNGVKMDREPDVEETTKRGSVGWLLTKYLKSLEAEVSSGRKSAKTLKKKTNLLNRLLPYADYRAAMPSAKVVELRDEMQSTPAQADAFVEALRVMYAWGLERGHVQANPAVSVKRIYRKGKGAEPWTAQDVRQFLEHHKTGTKANAALHVLLWTGCRIEDLTALGRHNETTIDGVEAVRFQPLKKGSALTTVPLSPQMKRATRALRVEGRTYILGRGGKPYASGDSMSAMFIRWCKEAGLEGKSAHGIRKALGEILAELGISQYGIMAVHGHNEARTSETYTRGADRWKLAKEAMEKMQSVQVWN